MPAIPSNILAEHQGAPKDDIAPGYNPSQEELEAVKLVEKLFTAAKRARSQYDQKWSELYKLYRGKHWLQKRPSYRHSEVLNYIFSEVQTVLVLMTDNRPQVEVLPEDPTDYDFAEIINEVIKYKWDNKNWSYILAEAITDAAIYGTAIAGIPWKPELEQGLGDFEFETEDPFHCFPDPNCRSKINDEYCDHFIIAKPKDVDKVRLKYPHVKDFIKSDVGDLSSYQDKEILEEIKYTSPTDNRVISEMGSNPKPTRPNQVVEITCFLRSNEMEEIEAGEETDPETGLTKKLYQSKKKYPNGRKIVIANNVLCEDGPIPYDDGNFPFARLVDYALPREFWGTGEVEQLKSVNLIVDKLISYVLDVLMIMGNPIWVVDDQSGVDTDNLTNQPGLVVEKRAGSEVRRESGAQLQPFVLDTLQFMANNVLAKLSSSAEVSKGIAPTDNASGYAIQQLQEAAQTKIRGKSKNVEYFLKDSGDLMVSRILQFYSVPRIIRLTNNAQSAQYFKFAINAIDDETGEVKKVAEVQEYMVDPLTKQYVLGPVRQIPLKSKLDVRFNIGSSLPFAKIENKALAEKLYDKKIIDTEEYLTQIDYPHKERVLQRLRQQAQAMGAMPPQPGQEGDPNAVPA